MCEIYRSLINACRVKAYELIYSPLFYEDLYHAREGNARELTRRILKAPRAVRQYNKIMSPVRLGTKNHCASEGQQQFTSQPVRELTSISEVKGEIQEELAAS
jgi:hypothetical protein